MKLNEEQKFVIQEVIKQKKSVQTVSGYAGTGKSTLIRHLFKLLPNFAVCAFTGKAANVLRKGGLPAKTIHSLIYKAYSDYDGKVYFSLAGSLDCDGIIVDEASMVSEYLYKDLKSFGKPLIFVGDHGQLEPIGDKFNLMSNPDYTLETIHRNAGEIAHFAEYIRKGFKPSSWQIRNGVGDQIKFVSKFGYEDIATTVDQVICAYNKTRAETNKMIRFKSGRGVVPEKGDRVMCLRNNAAKGLFNGMQGTVSEIGPEDAIVFSSEDLVIETRFDKKTFGQVKYEFESDRDSPMPFDYSYCITAHKSQGSEYDEVLVLEQKCDLWDHKRWAYTAASRARKKLYWCGA